MDGRALTSRRALIASLAAQGWSRPRIARALEISVSTVRDNLALPTVRAEIARESARLRQAVRFELTEAMAEEERATFDRWRELRDQDERPAVALAAVKMHIDRTLPRLGPAPPPPPPRPVLDAASLAALRAAMRLPVTVELEAEVEKEEVEHADRQREHDTGAALVERRQPRPRHEELLDAIEDPDADPRWSEAAASEAAAVRVPPATQRARDDADAALCALREADRRRARPDGADDAADADPWRDR